MTSTLVGAIGAAAFALGSLGSGAADIVGHDLPLDGSK